MEAYMQRQMVIILWIANHKMMSENEAGFYYVRIGLAEKFEKKHRMEYDFSKI